MKIVNDVEGRKLLSLSWILHTTNNPWSVKKKRERNRKESTLDEGRRLAYVVTQLVLIQIFPHKTSASCFKQVRVILILLFRICLHNYKTKIKKYQIKIK